MSTIRPNGPALCQPRPTAWVSDPKRIQKAPTGRYYFANHDDRTNVKLGSPRWGFVIGAHSIPRAVPWADIASPPWGWEEYDPPLVILDKLGALEKEIADDLKDLRGMVS